MSSLAVSDVLWVIELWPRKYPEAVTDNHALVPDMGRLSAELPHRLMNKIVQIWINGCMKKILPPHLQKGMSLCENSQVPANC
jgi:hypothetical protein